jgi:hypothetical protein
MIESEFHIHEQERSRPQRGFQLRISNFPKLTEISLPTPSNRGPPGRMTDKQEVIQGQKSSSGRSTVDVSEAFSGPRDERLKGYRITFAWPKNTGVERLDQHSADRKDLPLRLAGWFRHNGQYELAEQVLQPNSITFNSPAMKNKCKPAARSLRSKANLSNPVDLQKVVTAFSSGKRRPTGQTATGTGTAALI